MSKKTKFIKPKYRYYPMLLAYLSGVLSRWSRSSYDLYHTSFICKRITAYTRYAAACVNTLETNTAGFRADVLNTIAEYEAVRDQICRRSTGGKRASARSKLLAEQIVQLDDKLRSSILAAKEAIVPVSKLYKGQVIAYTNGLGKRITDEELEAIFSEESNDAFMLYCSTYDEEDKRISSCVSRITEKCMEG